MVNKIFAALKNKKLKALNRKKKKTIPVVEEIKSIPPTPEELVSIKAQIKAFKNKR